MAFTLRPEEHTVRLRTFEIPSKHGSQELEVDDSGTARSAASFFRTWCLEADLVESLTLSQLAERIIRGAGEVD